MNVISGGSEVVRWGEAYGERMGWSQEPVWMPPHPRTTSEDTARGLLLRGGLRAIRELGDESLRGRCARACGQESFFDFFDYPLRVLLQMVATALPPLGARHGDASHALWLMGNCMAMDFLESEAGRALRVLVRGETARLVNHLPTAYRMSLSGQRSVSWLGPQHCRLLMTRDFLPTSLHEGFLVGLLQPLNASRLQVEGFTTGPLDSEYDITWR